MAAKGERQGAGRRSMLVPTALLTTSGVVYGGILTANKIAIGAGFPFAAYTFWQTFLAGAVLLVFSLARGRPPGLGFAHVRHYVLTSSLGVVMPLLVLTYVADRLPAGVLTLIFALAAPLAYIFAFALGRERFQWLSVAGVAFGFAGILMIVVPEGTLPAVGAAVWMVFALAVPVMLATNNMVMAYLRPPAASTLALVSGLQLAAAAITFPVMIAAGGFYPFWTAPDPALWALAWAAAAQAITFLAVLEVVRRAGPVYTSQINYVIVVAGFLWALALFDEGLSGWVWGALGVMLAGLALAHAGAARRPTV